MDTIRISVDGESKFQEVLDLLRPLGVHVVTGTNDPIESVLFYIARMNSKLDNLGQLKHLHKFLKALENVADKAAIVYYDQMQERKAQQMAQLTYYHTLCEKKGIEPDSKFLRTVHYLTDAQIERLFVE